MLVVDDDRAICEALAGLLRDEGHEVVCVYDGEAALDLARRDTFDAILLDVFLPGMDGLQVLEKLRTGNASAEVVMISGQADLSTAVRATRLGAYDFLEKPLNPERVILVVRHIEEKRRLRRQMEALRRAAGLEEELVAVSEPMRALLEQVDRAAPSDGRILIMGENGTGKELIARRIHRLSRRSAGPFVRVNCAAVPSTLIESELFGYRRGAFTGATKDKRGLIEEANGGTLFLDEVGDMALETQAKLLRVLQENEFLPLGDTKPRRFDARVIAATNKDLAREMEAGRFREDLFYRLNVIPLYVPPLRERKEDIPALVDHFVQSYAQRNGQPPKQFTPEAVEVLLEYDWPGNVRELRNFVERMQIMCAGPEVGVDEVTAALPVGAGTVERPASTSGGSGSLRERLRRYERRILAEELRRAGGNISVAARRLKMDRANLSKKLKAYGLLQRGTSGE